MPARNGSEGSCISLARHHLFHQYIEASSLGVLLVAPDGTITFANASALACFDYEEAELLGQPIEALVPEPLRERHAVLREWYMEGPAPRPMRGRHLTGRRKGGAAVPVAVSLVPLSEGDTPQVACTVMDLSGVFRAEQDLSRFFELSLDLFCIASVDGFFLRVNANFSRVLGHPDGVLLSRPFVDFVHSDDVAATHRAVSELAAGRSVVRFRNRYRCESGAYRWFEWNSRAIPDEGTIFAAARDITEQVQLEGELIARERRERAILENTPAVVYVKGRDGRYEYVNQRYADLFFVTPTQAIGMSDHAIFPPEVADQFVGNDRQVFESARQVTLQEAVPQDDGVHTYASTKFPLFDAQGRVTAVAGISTDITDQLRARETEDQLRLARAFQMKLYPRRAPVVAGLDAAGSAVPVAQVCGDYYDFIPRGPGRLVVAMGDVSGHGIGPALEMVAVRTAMRLLLRDDSPLLRAVEELNAKLCDDLPESTFVSLFLAELDTRRKQIRYVGAGHEAAIVRDSGEVRRLTSTGPLLGIDGSALFEEGWVAAEAGDMFLLNTDGLSEAMNLRGEQFSTRRLVEVVTRSRHLPAEAVIGAVFAAVYEFTSGKAIADDMTLVTVKFVG